MILREALERLNQNPTNSSKPSSSLAPWDKSSSDDDDATSIFDEQEALNSEIDQERSSDVTTDQTTEDTNNDCCLTNNEAERALRHWVILRRITQGTRFEQGSRALALFASMFATSRLRDSSPLLYLRDVI